MGKFEDFQRKVSLAALDFGVWYLIPGLLTAYFLLRYWGYNPL